MKFKVGKLDLGLESEIHGSEAKIIVGKCKKGLGSKNQG